MTIGKHITTFAGLPVKKFTATMDPPDNPSGCAWRAPKIGTPAEP
jgi:hypothetical protein